MSEQGAPNRIPDHVVENGQDVIGTPVYDIYVNYWFEENLAQIVWRSSKRTFTCPANLSPDIFEAISVDRNLREAYLNWLAEKALLGEKHG